MHSRCLKAILPLTAAADHQTRPGSHTFHGQKNNHQLLYRELQQLLQGQKRSLLSGTSASLFAMGDIQNLSSFGESLSSVLSSS